MRWRKRSHPPVKKRKYSTYRKKGKNTGPPPADSLSEEAWMAEASLVSRASCFSFICDELRIPLTAITGYTYLLHNTDLSPKQQAYLEKLDLAGQSLRRLIGDTLDFSQMNAGKIKLEKKQFSLFHVIRKVFGMMDLLARQKGLFLYFNLYSDVPEYLIGDPLRVEEILLNLISNAVKFTETGNIVLTGEVIKELEYEVIIQFSIKDSGAGMTKKQQEIIFDPYVQTENQWPGIFNGTGLGLTICKKICRLMNGDMTVNSTPGEGTEFVFTLKFMKTEKQNEYNLPPDMASLKILLFTGDPGEREVFEDYLTSYSLAADSALTEGELQRKLHTNSYDVLVLNREIESANSLASRSGLGDIKIMAVLPCKGQELFLEKAYNTRIDNIIESPVSRRSFFNALVGMFEDSYESRCFSNRDYSKISEPINGSHVLFIADNYDNQIVVMEILKEEGFSVSVCSDGAEILKYLRCAGEPVDIILLDLHTPHMDGYDIARMIKQDPDYGRIPILAISVNSSMDFQHRIYKSGIDDFISKPVDVEILFTKLLRWITPGRPGASINCNHVEPGKINRNQFKYLNLDKGMKRINYRKEFYSEMLTAFMRRNKNVIEAILVCLKNKNTNLTGKLLYDIREGARDIGADRLSHAIDDLNKTLYNWKTTHNTLFIKLTRLGLELGHLFEEIEFFLKAAWRDGEIVMERSLLPKMPVSWKRR